MKRQIVDLDGVCCKEVSFIEECDHIFDIEFQGGCPGGLSGIACLTNGMSANKIVEYLKGITCGKRNTSCADQLARAVEDYIIQKNLGTANGTE